MNKEQAEYLKGATCGIIERLDPQLDDLKEHGMLKIDSDRINNFLNEINQMNQKYARLSK